MSIWLLMIVLHTLCALISFVTGVLLLSLSKVKRYPFLLRAFIVSLVGMIVFMIFATLSHWGEISLVERIAFSLLPFLGIHMVYRAVLAARKLRAGDDIRYIDDIGFGLISLFNGFIIVALIDLNAPSFVIPVVAVVATTVGARYVGRAKQKSARAIHE